jgi:parallel beta-helix repeat protein
MSASVIEDNVISGNGYEIRLVGSNNQITGNMIGTDRTSDQASAGGTVANCEVAGPRHRRGRPFDGNRDGAAGGDGVANFK